MTDAAERLNLGQSGECLQVSALHGPRAGPPVLIPLPVDAVLPSGVLTRGSSVQGMAAI